MRLAGIEPATCGFEATTTLTGIPEYPKNQESEHAEALILRQVIRNSATPAQPKNGRWVVE
jgi:hypothetical protein